MKIRNLLAVLYLNLTLVCTTHATNADLSAASGGASALPLAVSVLGAGGAAVLVTEGSSFVVKSVQASGQGAVWILERASDGVQASVEVAGKHASDVTKLVGSTVVTTVFASGVLLSAAGQIIAFVPNEVGRALMYHQPIK